MLKKISMKKNNTIVEILYWLFLNGNIIYTGFDFFYFVYLRKLFSEFFGCVVLFRQREIPLYKIPIMIKSKNWWLITIKGLIFIFLGFYILKFPISGMLGLIIYGSVSLFISGFILATFAIITRKIHRGWGWQMAEGLLDIFLAVILLLNIGLQL